MRNRSNFNFSPAQGSVGYTPQQAQPQPGYTVNYDRLLLLLFFVAVPLLWVFSLIFKGFLWIMFFVILGAIALLWLKKGFTARGRLSMTGIYAIFAMLALTSLLQGRGNLAAINTTKQNPVSPILLASTTAPTANYGESTGVADSGVIDATNQSSGKSACEQVLIQFLDCWKAQKVTDMVSLTAQSWRQKAAYIQNGAEQSLYMQISGKKLDSYILESEPTGTDNDTSRTISVLATVSVKEELRQIRYYALILNENGQWLVDPSSLVSGTRVDNSTPAPDNASVSVVSATATPKPTAKPKSGTKLYYNAKGGSYYHIDPECSSVAKKYLPLKSFTYGNINKSPQNKLEPCEVCGAPGR